MIGWSQTTNLNLATALATCGVDFDHESILDEPTGKATSTFHLALKSKDGGISTPGALARIRNGTMMRDEPEHPLCDCLAGINTREKLLTWLNRGVRCRVVPIIHTSRAETVEGSDSFLPVGELVSTPDLKLASALMRCGFPCVGIDGHGAERRFLIRNESLIGPGKASDLARKIRDGSLAQENDSHPALWVLMALRNRDNILSLIKRSAKLVVIRNPRSEDWRRWCRSAVVFENSSAKALDQVQRHLRIL